MFRTALESLKIGDPFDEATTLGPLSSEAALTLLLKQVDEAVAHGAKILTGGKRVDRKGSFMQATILTNITPDNPAYKQEFFGPVALVLPAKDEEEAIAIANDSPFGLGGSIYTKDIDTASGWLAESKPAWSSSTTLPSVQRTCLSVESRGPAMAKNCPILESRNSSTRN